MTRDPKNKLRRISIMGSTGSIGTQSLNVIECYPDLFEAVALTAGSNWRMLASQALKFRPSMVAIADESHYSSLKAALSKTGIHVAGGKTGLIEAAELQEADIVIGALVGYNGLPSVIAALEAGKTVALANKETLVVAGELIQEIIRRKGKRILPIDSEHSAIFQCLWGEDTESVSKIILTASGGPFRNCSREELRNVTVAQALAHPNWEMGTKVTIDSASMMNKGFEMIEARWLFDKKPGDIEVVVHPESIVHSMVEFIDGSVKAQLGIPDMRLPIEVALSYPNRLDMRKKLGLPRLNLAQTGKLTFEQPDMEKFPLLKLAYNVAETGGVLPAVMNAVNEVAVREFIEGNIRFTDISTLVIKAVEEAESSIKVTEVTLATIAAAHRRGMEIASTLLKYNLI